MGVLLTHATGAVAGDVRSAMLPLHQLGIPGRHPGWPGPIDVEPDLQSTMRRPLRTSFSMLSLLAAMLAAQSGPAAAQENGAARERRVLTTGFDVGFTAVDERQIINASAFMLRLGGEIATTGPVYGFAGVQGMMPFPPVSGSGGDSSQDSAGNLGRHDAGNLSLAYLRAGLGARFSLLGREVAVRGTAARGLDGDKTPWLSTGARVQLRRAVSLEAEAGWSHNWTRDTYYNDDVGTPPEWEVVYVDEFEGWLRTLHLGIRFGR